MEGMVPGTLPCTQYRLEASAASESHGGGGKWSLADHLQEAAVGGGRARASHAQFPPHPPGSGTRVRHNASCPRRGQQDSSWLGTETHDLGQDEVLWSADVSQAPCFSM